MKRTLVWLLLISSVNQLPAQSIRTVDVCVYGGTSGGVMAAYAARKMGKSVVLIEPGRHLGGLTTGGLGYTDIGNKYAITGLSLDFYRRLGKHYGNFEQWIFEPSVAENLFREYIKRGDVPVVYGHRIVSAKKVNGTIQEITLETPLSSVQPVSTVRAKMFIDATYEGDLMARAGVNYTIGREANSQYNETWNGVQILNGHQFADGVDPYKVPGKPESGLLWGISPEPPAAPGTGDKKVQAYNFRICLTSNPANRIPITRPEGYDSTRYELLLRAMEKDPKLTFNRILKPDRMPNQKTDINNFGPFSTDMIGMNYDFPEADYNRRAQIQREHELYNKGLLYFIGHDPRMRPDIREQMLTFGYPKDEYTDNGNWSPQMYVREARRLIGDYVMTQANCEGKDVVKDGVGMAAYTMDSHNCQRVVIEKNGMKMVKNEGNVEVGGFPPYPISYRSLIPKQNECRNLLVPVCLSASHIAYGSIRMEPVFMVLGQSAAVAASLAIDQKQPVQQVNVAAVQKILIENPLLDGSTPDVVVDNDNAGQVTLTGDWKNETRGSYGRSLVVDDSKGQSAKAVRFSPTLPKAGQYDLYAYFPRRPDASSQTTLLIHDGTRTQPVTLKKETIQVEGQTAGAWVKIGTFAFPAGKKAYVDVTNQGADGVVVADAMQWIAVK
ncbi:FAD-dependent oxidoreductase [Fibrisoma montanum]|uniref:FAD-dependent oxidoreductase n=1 Tax=Fibrisoma montanum TaxID=2305895 RepID=A0A418M4K9_9BACT|nr:FAD-dependent oxidoreductase [Fibrisoma montanum]RIV20688.1 FAD-dependent oxidoreductase [Fibrisoma montanum]